MRDIRLLGMTVTGMAPAPELLRTLQPIAQLGALRLDELLHRCCIERIPAGLILFREGDTDRQAIYLLRGEVVVSSATHELSDILTAPCDAGDASLALHPIADKQPRQQSAMAMTDLDILRVDGDLLDSLLAWDDLSHQCATSRPGGPDGTSAGTRDWMACIRHSLVFRQIPLPNLELLGARLAPVTVRAGQVVIREGEDAESYYLIESGMVTVTRETDDSGPVAATILEAGSGFGEESLRDESSQSEMTVTMKTRGILLRLGRQEFLDLRREPQQHLISPSDARTRLASGNSVWLDIRGPGETEHARLPNARLAPLRSLRSLAGALERQTEYICYCNSGRRSMLAAHLLRQLGINAHSLAGGLQALPESGDAGSSG
ncbi:MAG: cyclic nucleotide-binding domain-containing protein [Acidiferrobacterales bacterium]